MNLLLAALLLFYELFSSAPAYAFPEAVRHHYLNCVTCHTSPTGGGVLTPYGRQYSGELLSTWRQKEEKEAQFAYGVVTPPEWLDLMAQARGVHTYTSTPTLTRSQTILMQADLEPAIYLGRFALVGTLGYQENSTVGKDFGDHLISRRHYLLYRPDEDISLRAGRFFPAFGIYTPDHIIPTKRGLGWDEGRESYNIEAALLKESYNVYLTGILGRPDQPSLNRETGGALSVAAHLGDSYKIGASYSYLNGQFTHRHLTGVWGILGFTPRFFLLSEWDYQNRSSKTGTFGPQSGMANYQRLNYEVIPGLHIYLTQDLLFLDFDVTRGLTNSYGMGLQFFPRTHYELNLSWQKTRTLSTSADYTDFAWFMLNIYL